MGAVKLLIFIFLLLCDFVHADTQCPSIQNNDSQILYERLLDSHNATHIRQLCNSLSQAESSGPEFNLNRIQEDLNFYVDQNSEDLVHLLWQPSDESNEITPLEEPVSFELLNLFNKIQLSVFKAAVLDLKLCENCHSFTASYSDKTVYLPPQQIANLYLNPRYQNPDNAMAFIFAHEISHFLQNSYSLRHNNTTPSDLVYLPTAESSQMAFIGSINQIQSINSHLHSEVDHYALEIYKRAGFTGFFDISLWFLETSWMIGSSSNTNGDFSPLMDLNFRRLQLEKHSDGE